MENYLALLLLVVPGFIAYNINEKLNDDQVAKDKFDLAIKAMVYNVFIVLANYAILLMFFGNLSFAILQEQFQQLEFVVCYIMLTLSVSMGTGLMWNIGNRIFYRVINKIRKAQNKNALGDRSVFDDMFADGKEHIVKISYNGVESFGNLSKIGERGRKEAFVLGCNAYEEYKRENPELLNKVSGVYYDFDGGFSIVEYENDIPISSEVEA